MAAMKYTGVEGVISSRWGGLHSSGVVNGFNTYQYWEIFNANIAYWLYILIHRSIITLGICLANMD